MKNILLFTILFLITNVAVFAQSQIPEFERVRQIKLLQSTRADVKKILSGYEYDKEDDEDSTQDFSTKNADVEVTFSVGNCSDEADETDEWNVPKESVTKIEISLNEPLKIKNFKFDISDFRKEQKYHDIDDLYIYHNKNLGIAFDVDDGEIKKVYLFPTRSFYSSLCENEESEQLKEFYSTQSYFGNTKLEDRKRIISDINANVESLTLSTNELVMCPADVNDRKCSSRMEVLVNTKAIDAEGDTLVYHYSVSGGRIVGEGKDVTWDLSGVAPGKYTITAGVDDGCGVCGKTKTQTVEIKDCIDCQKSPK